MTVPATSLIEALSQGATPLVETGASAPATPFAAVIATLFGGAAGRPAATLAPGEDDGSSALDAGLAFGHALPAGTAGADGVFGRLGQPAGTAGADGVLGRLGQPAGTAGADGVFGRLGQPADTALPGALPSPGATARGDIDPFDPAATLTALPERAAPAGLPSFVPAPGPADAAAPAAHAPAAPASEAAASRVPFAPIAPGGVAAAATPASPPPAQTPDGSNEASAATSATPATALRALDAGRHAAPPAPPGSADEMAFSRGTAPVPTPPVRVQFDAAPPAAPASEGAASRVPIAPGGVAAAGTPASPPAAQTPDGSNEASAAATAATPATALRSLDAGRHAAPPALPGPADEMAFSRGTAPAVRVQFDAAPPAAPVRVQFDAAPPAAPGAPPPPSARLSGEAALATTAAAGPNPPSTAPGAAVAKAAAAMADAGETTPHPNGAARGATDGVIPPSTGAHPKFTRGDSNAAADTSHSATQSLVLGDARFGAVSTAPQQPAQAMTGGAPVTDPDPVPPREVTEQVTLQLRSSIRKGADRITIQLKPAALGTIDIKLDVAHDGRVTAVISADRADTLDLLQRDARGIERALHDAGLRTDSGSLSFNLRGEGRHHALADADTGAGAGPHPDDAAPGEPNGPEGGRASASNHVLDIEV